MDRLFSTTEPIRWEFCRLVAAGCCAVAVVMMAAPQIREREKLSADLRTTKKDTPPHTHARAYLLACCFALLTFVVVAVSDAAAAACVAFFRYLKFSYF